MRNRSEKTKIGRNYGLTRRNDWFVTLILVSVCCNILHKIKQNLDQRLSSMPDRQVWKRCRNRSARDPTRPSQTERGGRYQQQRGIRSSPRGRRQLDTTADVHPAPRRFGPQQREAALLARRRPRRHTPERSGVAGHPSSNRQGIVSQSSWRTFIMQTLVCMQVSLFKVSCFVIGKN
jgi:hypothetical protein